MSNRGKFSSKIGFIAAASGSAVGLYNMWKFPYEVGANGGAAFLFLYLGCIMLLGYPLVVAELALGRKMQTNAYDAIAKAGNKKWGLIGFFAILIALLVLSFYNVIAGWILGYCIETFQGNLMNTENFTLTFKEFIKDTPSNFAYTFILIFTAALIIRNGVKEGIEKWSKILMPFFILLLFGLIIYSLTLENSYEGLKFYLWPDFSNINWDTLYIALGQSFVSLSVGFGVLITYGTYLQADDDIASSAAIIALSDTFVSFLAGLMLFPFIFSLNLVPNQGPGLVFVSLPKVFQNLGPYLGPFIGGTFFLLLILAALTSSISLLESLVKYIVEKHQIERKKAVIIASIGIFLLSIPSILSQGGQPFFTEFLTFKGKVWSFLDLIDAICSKVAINLICLFMSIFVAYKWRTKNLLQEVQGTEYHRKWLAFYLHITIAYICPVILTIISAIEIWGLIK